MFSVVNAIIFRPLPVKDANRLRVIAATRNSAPTLGPLSFGEMRDYQLGARDVFEDIAGYSVGFIGLAVAHRPPARVLVTWVTGNYFSVLGVRPSLGRLISPEEGLPGRIDRVAVLGHSTSSLLFGVRPGDALSFSVAAACISTATLLSIYLPSRHATRVDPMIALRAE